jgi:hypothetical protein
VLDQKLEVGGQAIQVTVEGTAEAIQTQNAANGGLVSGDEINALPLVSRNYTQIISRVWLPTPLGRRASETEPWM